MSKNAKDDMEDELNLLYIFPSFYFQVIIVFFQNSRRQSENTISEVWKALEE